MAGVVIVTGASAGIGRACADRLHASGWTVFGASRRGTSSGGWVPLKMNVDDDEEVSSGVSSVIEAKARLDAVIACAGWGLSRRDLVRLVGAALPQMRAQGAGRIVLVSSLGGLIALPFQAFYSASKFAMEGYGEALAYEVAPFGIHVTLVEPGNFKTDFTASRRGIPASEEDNPYASAAAKAIAIMERDEANGAPPESVAKLVERVLTARRPPRRVSAGKMGERIGVVAKRLLPHRLFEKAASGALGV